MNRGTLLSYIPPSFPGGNVADAGNAYSEFGGNVDVAHSSANASSCPSDILGRQLSAGIHATPLPIHVDHVIQRGTKEEMGRVTVRRVIAFVQGPQAIWNRSIGINPRESMCQSARVQDPKDAIAFALGYSHPIPAFIGGTPVDFRPEILRYVLNARRIALATTGAISSSLCFARGVFSGFSAHRTRHDNDGSRPNGTPLTLASFAVRAYWHVALRARSGWSRIGVHLDSPTQNRGVTPREVAASPGHFVSLDYTKLRAQS